MRKIATSLAVSAAIAAVIGLFAFSAAAARAGDCSSGFRCDNVCPLAQKANERRATGNEAMASASTVRAARVAEVLRMLKRV